MLPKFSGFNSCAAKISEFIDYIKDTWDFVQKIESDVAPTTISSKTILATMDVSSLYPNIDHEKSVKACEYALSKRKTPLIPTSVLTNLIMTVLKSNTLNLENDTFIRLKVLPWGPPWL